MFFVSNRVEKKNPWGSLESICPLFWGCFTLKTRVLYNQNIEYPDTCFISSNLVLRVLYILNTNKKTVPPWKKRTCPLTKDAWKFCHFLLKWSLFRFHVNWGCTLFKKTTPHFLLPKRCGRATSPIRSCFLGGSCTGCDVAALGEESFDHQSTKWGKPGNGKHGLCPFIPLLKNGKKNHGFYSPEN